MPRVADGPTGWDGNHLKPFFDDCPKVTTKGHENRLKGDRNKRVFFIKFRRDSDWQNISASE